jgi:hypothetical protein
MSSRTFEKKMSPDGKLNPKYVDLLNEDPVIPSQMYGCYSFVSPEKIIRNRELFMFEKFVKQWQYSKAVAMFSDFTQFLSYKYSINPENILNDLVTFCKEEENVLKREDVVGDFKQFMDKNEERLAEEYNRDNQFQTSVRGFINRGNFASPEEAEKYAKELRDRDPNHDIFVGRNFVWTPLDPDAYKTGRIEFLEEELNQLHHEKLKNEKKAKEEFEKRLYDAKRKAIEENVRQAKSSGNKLTQTMDADGNLVGANTINYDEREAAEPIQSKKPFSNSLEDDNNKKE